MVRSAGLAGLILAMMLAPELGVAQRVPGPGDRVRVTLLDGVEFVGNLAASSKTHLALALDSLRLQTRKGRGLEPTAADLAGDHPGLSMDATGSVIEVNLAHIATTEVSLGPRRSFLKSLGVTTAVVAGGVGILSATTWEPCVSGEFLGCFMHPESRAEALGQGAFFGAVYGLAIGTLVGIEGRRERWEVVDLSGPASVPLTVRPSFGRQIGFVMTLHRH